MKKLFTLSLFFILIMVFLSGCGQKSYVDIVSATLEAQSDRTIIRTSISVNSNWLDYWELYPEIDAKLLDNLGNEYSVLQTKDSNFSGEIRESGVYHGTLIFPRLTEEATFLRLRIDNIRHYAYGDYDYYLEGLYVITFNFDLNKTQHIVNDIPYAKAKQGKKQYVKRSVLEYDSITVSTIDGEEIFEIRR